MDNTKTSKDLTKETILVKRMVNQFLQSIAFNDKSETIADILNIIDNPFVDNSKNDAISLIFHRFYKNTDIHPALPIFSFFSMLSAWCVINKTTCTIPKTPTRTELDTWVLLLSESGAAKSLANSIIVNSMPKDLNTGKTLIDPNFVQPASNASLVQQLEELPNHRGYWRQDEGSQFIKQIDQIAGPMAQIKQSLLLIKDHGRIDYATKTNGKISIDGPVLTVLMINTIKAMQKAMTEDSMIDGTFRRFTVAMAKKYKEDEEQKLFQNTALYEITEISDRALEESMSNIFDNEIYDRNFTFSKPCVKLYEEAFKAFWEKQYEKFMSESKNYYRTYMMEAWRYAVFHHLIHKKSGNVVDEYSLQWGLKVSMYLLNSLQAFIGKLVDKSEASSEKQRIEKIMKFITENEGKPNFGIRALSRKFSLTKGDAMSYLSSIKVHDKKFKTSLFDDLIKWQKEN